MITIFEHWNLNVTNNYYKYTNQVIICLGTLIELYKIHGYTVI